MNIRLRKNHRRDDDLELRDQLIHALYIRLRAERETREAIAEAARAGASAEVIEALAIDPIPPIDNLGRAKTVETLLRRLRGLGQTSVGGIVDA